ncbi:MAG: zinc-dependent metalloprotease [Chitinophagaceae bacterium]|nr:zinc-dependent metalloprotease [Chitinophagaceae bacterium]
MKWGTPLGCVIIWVIEKLKDNRLWFGTETNPDDPRSQSEQVGDDAMKGSLYGIKNLQRIVPNLKEWTKMPNEDYSNLRNMYNGVVGQYQRYIGHVTKYVGGIMETPKMVEESGPVYENVSEEKQREAVDFLNKQLFATPAWLLNQEIFEKTGLSGLTVVSRIQDNALYSVISNYTLTKLVNAEAAIGNKAYQVTELLSDLKKGIWSELATRKPVDIFRRQLQKSYVNSLAGLLKIPAPVSMSSGGVSLTISQVPDKSDISSVVKGHLLALRSEILVAQSGINDTMTKYHLQDVAKTIDNTLNPKN